MGCAAPACMWMVRSDWWARACTATAHLASGYELAELVSDRRTQMAADALRLRLCHRARCGGAPPGNDHRGQLTYQWPRQETAIQPILSRSCHVVRVGSRPGAMIRHLGRAGIAALVQEHCRLAARFAERLVREPRRACAERSGA